MPVLHLAHNTHGVSVRKRSGKEPAGRCAVTVTRTLWGLQRAMRLGAGVVRHRGNIRMSIKP